MNGFVQNNPVNYYDILGEWMPGTHKKITQDSLKETDSIIQSNIPNFARIIRNMKYRIVRGNVSQDYEHLLDHRRHYSYTGSEDPKAVAEQYDSYLREENARFNKALEKPSVENCAEALKSLGLLSHTWQDYYGHGVLADKDLSVEARRDIFSKNGVNMGTPEKRGDLFPASWSWNPFNGNTEHPSLGRGEPVRKNTSNYDARYYASVSFVAYKFRQMLPTYWDKCNCYSKELLTYEE